MFSWKSVLPGGAGDLLPRGEPAAQPPRGEEAEQGVTGQELPVHDPAVVGLVDAQADWEEQGTRPATPLESGLG